MLKKLLVLSLMSIIVNVFAMDLYGLWELDSDDSILNEDLHIYPGGIIQPYNAHRTLTVNGNIINEGTIQDYPIIGYQIYVNCSGNLTNTGSITNNKITLNGTSSQTLNTGSTTPITSQYFTVTNTNPIYATSVLYFKNSIIDFPSGGSISLIGGYSLNIDGGYLNNGDIIGKPGIALMSYLKMTNGAYINDLTCSNIILQNDIYVENNVIFEEMCDNYGTILAATNGHRTLTVNDNFTNFGSITNNVDYYLTVNSNGNFTNNGIITNNNLTCYGDLINNTATFTPYYLYFSGTDIQKLTTAFGCPVSSTYTNCTNSLGITSPIDLYFENSLINFNDHPFTISNGYGLYISGGYMNNTRITGAGVEAENISYFDMSDDSYLQNTKLQDIVLSGTIDLSDDNCSLNGTILNYATIQNKSWNSFTLTINDNFVNSGVITSNPGGYYLYIDFYGTDLHNGGTWTNQMLTFAGTAVQNLSNDFSTPFSPVYTSCSNDHGVKAKSNLEFVNSLINFNGDYLIDLTEGHNLYISGGYMNNTSIIGAGTTAKAQSTFEAANGFYMQNTTLEDLVLTGTFDLSDDNCELNGTILNYAAIQNKSWNTFTLTINADFENAGIIRSNPNGYYLYIDYYGTNLHNSGTWTNQMLTFAGTAVQNLSNDFSTPFSPVYTSCTNSNGVLAKSNLEFVNSLINFNGDYLIDLTEGYNLYISGGYMNHTSIIGAGTTAKAQSNFEAANGFYMQNTTLEDLVLNGTIEFSDDNCELNGTILNYGTIQNKSWNSYALTINDDFDNQGVIKNNMTYNFYINATGDVKNSGTWTNNTTNFTGTTDQHIVMTFGTEIASPNLYFKSEIIDAPYEWYCNNNPIEATNTDFSGIDIDNLRWLVPIDLDHSGAYFCQTNAGPTRKIFVYDGTWESPVITEFLNNGTSYTISWNEIPSCSMYFVEHSDDPYSDSWSIGLVLPSHITTWDIPVGEETKQFYRVKAVY